MDCFQELENYFLERIPNLPLEAKSPTDYYEKLDNLITPLTDQEIISSCLAPKPAKNTQPRKQLTNENYHALYSKMLPLINQNLSKEKIAKELKISRRTVYRILDYMNNHPN